MGQRRRTLASLLSAAALLALAPPAPAQDAPGTLRGVVFDSVLARPLSGARVALVGTGRSEAAGEDGAFAFANLAAGTYSLLFSHPRADSLGYAPAPVAVTVQAGAESRRDLAIPSLGAVLNVSCLLGAGRGALAGFVRETDGNTRVAGAPVAVSWPESADGRILTATTMAVTDRRGVYRVCSLPAGVPLTVEPRVPGTFGIATELALADGERALADLDVAAAPELAVREPPRRLDWAEVAGRLYDAETGRPVEGAAVMLGDSLSTAATRRGGSFHLGSVPIGRHRVTVVHPEYGERNTELFVTEGGVLDLVLRLPGKRYALDPLVATVARRDRPAVQARALGHRRDVLTREDIERRQVSANHVGDLMRGVPGLWVYEVQNPNVISLKEVCISTTPELDPGAGCIHGLQVFLDGIPVMDSRVLLRDLPLNAIESVEYIRPGAVDGRLVGLSGRGALLIQTRQGETASRQ